MKAARALRWARLTAGLSQRELADKAGIPQSTIGRIETGKIDPRTSTLSRLIRACGYDLEVEPRLGVGVDRTLILEQLERSPAERLEAVGRGAKTIDLIQNARRIKQAR